MHRTFGSETTSGDFSPSLDPFAERSNSYAHTHFSNSPRERQYKIESISLEIYVRHIQVRYNNILYGWGCQYWHLWISLNKTKWITHSNHHFSLTLNCSPSLALTPAYREHRTHLLPFGDIIHTLWPWVLFSVNFACGCVRVCACATCFPAPVLLKYHRNRQQLHHIFPL